MTGVPPIEDRYWFDDLADFLGPAYLPNAFTSQRWVTGTRGTLAG